MSDNSTGRILIINNSTEGITSGSLSHEYGSTTDPNGPWDIPKDFQDMLWGEWQTGGGEEDTWSLSVTFSDGTTYECSNENIQIEEDDDGQHICTFIVTHSSGTQDSDGPSLAYQFLSGVGVVTLEEKS